MKNDLYIASVGLIALMEVKDPALYAHTLKRINTMTPAALLNRADKSGDKKLVYFAKVLLDNGWKNTAVFEKVIETIIARALVSKEGELVL